MANYDDYISREPDYGEDYHPQRESREPLQPCKYCLAGERQTLEQRASGDVFRCQVCGDTLAAEVATQQAMVAAFARVLADARRKAS